MARHVEVQSLYNQEGDFIRQGDQPFHCVACFGSQSWQQMTITCNWRQNCIVLRECQGSLYRGANLLARAGGSSVTKRRDG